MRTAVRAGVQRNSQLILALKSGAESPALLSHRDKSMKDNNRSMQTHQLTFPSSFTSTADLVNQFFKSSHAQEKPFITKSMSKCIMKPKQQSSEQILQQIVR